jgi:hypothetical protein
MLSEALSSYQPALGGRSATCPQALETACAILSFFGRWIQRMVPQAGLLGSLAGIGLALLGTLPLIDVFGMPLVGVLALGLHCGLPLPTLDFIQGSCPP